MPKPIACALGIDLGTSAVKIAAAPANGKVVASARKSYPTISGRAGQAEQNPRQWLRAISAAAQHIKSQLRQKYVVGAIGLTGQMPTLVMVRNGKPIGNAITWQDTRADDWAQGKVTPYIRRDVYLKTGVLVDGRYLAPMFHFHHKSLRTKDHVILSAKDFIFFALTGIMATDPSTASGYALYNLSERAWDQELCTFWDIACDRLPPIHSSTFRAPLNQQGKKILGCQASIPVTLGCADSVAGALALIGDSQHLLLMTGSSTVILKCDTEPQWDPASRFLVTPLALEGMFGREADLLASGSARTWANRVLADDNPSRVKSLWKEAYALGPGADGLFFAPFLAGGEQGVLWNSELRGALLGLTFHHDAPAIARALMEGICFEIRRCVDAFEEESPIKSARLSGWMAEIPEQSQLLADVLGRSLVAIRHDSVSALGAAQLTGRTGNNHPSPLKGVMFRPSKQSARYREMYNAYRSRIQT